MDQSVFFSPCQQRRRREWTHLAGLHVLEGKTLDHLGAVVAGSVVVTRHLAFVLVTAAASLLLLVILVQWCVSRQFLKGSLDALHDGIDRGGKKAGLTMARLYTLQLLPGSLDKVSRANDGVTGFNESSRERGPFSPDHHLQTEALESVKAGSVL